MKRRNVILLFFVVLLSASLSVFANGAKEEEITKGPVTIQFWHSMGSKRGELMQQIVADFNASQSDIIVESTYQGSYYDIGAKLQAAVASGSAPSVAQMEIGRIGMYALADKLVDLKPFFTEDKEDVNDLIGGLMNYSYYNNKLISLPCARSTPAMYYNKALFKAAGLDPSKGPETWDDLENYAAKLTKNGVYGFSVPIDSWYYLSMVMAAGGDIFNKEGNNIGFNNVSGTKPLTFWLDMIKKGYMLVPAGQDYNSSEACRSAFTAGKTAIIMQSSGSYSELVKNSPFEVGVCFMPKDVRFAVPPGGANLIMLTGNPTLEAAAWTFLKYMTNAENSARWSIGTGYFPTRYSAIENSAFKEYLSSNKEAQTLIDQLKYADYPSPFQPEYAEVKDVIINNEIQKCILQSEYTPEMAVKSMYTRTAELF
ncbi:ABC transporter substrate-binding protein [uncultured Sphaerochaeta sp.]|uniref:ABC transporter substrate-binding protein n=1 Tax=uncultured Sphaerochaeta sp. TaxID=886478 RepID=UPI002A0A9925|nr:ABC transporter substrate-binding protein [uncultured Sphaerochaeta sp.]